ncbi:uncharacterized protein LOC132756415 [Ruditapes philippinarum]|uniref:uncharacterized protein LOC132756415 n=1 Tax=Ruditapes philippinarum TaxID=129788 RepID=UPI00295BF752|nr:uncharacterized protein LOC132756415 [Ruditapes philippinarum]
MNDRIDSIEQKQDSGSTQIIIEDFIEDQDIIEATDITAIEGEVHLTSNFGDKFLQEADLHTTWYLSFRCLVIRERELKRNKNRLAVLRSAMSGKVTIRPNESVHITCYTDKELEFQPTTAFIQECEDSSLPSYLDITPAVTHYELGKNKSFTVNFSNLTMNTCTISPRAIICELQSVIDLLDETPFKQRHRRIPTMMTDEIRSHLKQLLAAGIIRKSRVPWCSNVELVGKKNGKLRICVDYRMLNNKSVKDSYAIPRIEEVFDVLKGSKYFSTIDQKAGYHQEEIEETHKERTAFTVGSLRFFKYVKMPFGLSNSPAT